MAVSFSLYLPPFLSVEVIIVVSQPLAEHSSLTGHWFWTEMIKQADHGWWTSTAPPLFGANTHGAKRLPPHMLCQVSAKPRGKFHRCVVYQHTLLILDYKVLIKSLFLLLVFFLEGGGGYESQTKNEDKVCTLTAS